MLYEIFSQGDAELEKLKPLLALESWDYDEQRQSYYKHSQKTWGKIVKEVNDVCKIDLSAKTESGDDAYTMYCEDGVFYGDMLSEENMETSPEDDYVNIVYINHATHQKDYSLTPHEKKLLEDNGWRENNDIGFVDRFEKRFPDSGAALIEFKELIKRDLHERFMDPCETCSYGRVHSFKMQKDDEFSEHFAY